MKTKFVNRVDLEGYLYDFNLNEKTVQREDSPNYGKPFINGTIDVATNEELTNVVTVHFSYVTPTYKSGKNNRVYSILKNWIEAGETGTVVTVGKDGARKISVNTAIDLNDFYSANDSDTPQLVSAKRCEGGFINTLKEFTKEEKARNKFKVDFLINGTKVIEADEEKKIPEDYMILKGAAFNFMGRILPMDFHLHSEGGMKYFEDLEPSAKNPIFTSVWGSIVSQQTKVQQKTESAWGDDDDIVEYTRTKREWVVTGTASEPYDMDGDQGFTAEELKEKMQDREVYLAGVKKNYDEYQASKNGGAKAKTEEASTTAAEGGFNFF